MSSSLSASLSESVSASDSFSDSPKSLSDSDSGIWDDVTITFFDNAVADTTQTRFDSIAIYSGSEGTFVVVGAPGLGYESNVFYESKGWTYEVDDGIIPNIHINKYNVENNPEYGYKGAVYVYKYDELNSTWLEPVKLEPHDPDDSSNFGFSVAISKNFFHPGEIQIAVGAPKETGEHKGAVYVFESRQYGAEFILSGHVKGNIHNLKDEAETDSMPTTRKPWTRLGTSVAFSEDGEYMAVGAYAYYVGNSVCDGDDEVLPEHPLNNDSAGQTEGRFFIFEKRVVGSESLFGELDW